MCSLSCYYTIVNHEDDITVHNRAQTMRHRHHRTRVSLSPRLQRRQELILILTVQRTRRLVQKKDRGIAQNRSRQRQTLLLTSRYRLSHCSQIGIESIGHLVDEVQAQRLLQLSICQHSLHTELEIGANGSSEHHRLLIDSSKQTTVPVQIQRFDEIATE